MFKLLTIATIIFIIFNAFPSLPYNSNEILEAINQVRIENNLPALINSSILENTASQKIDEIEKDQNFNDSAKQLHHKSRADFPTNVSNSCS